MNKAVYNTIQFFRKNISKVFFDKDSRNRIQGKEIADFSIISANCIGGVTYHKLGMPFLSPTINMYFMFPDFVTFCERLDEFIFVTPEASNNPNENEHCPLLELKLIDGTSITIHCLHYESADEAIEKWEERKKRINLNNIKVVCTDRDGFNENDLARFNRLKYDKVIFTSRPINSEYYVEIKDFRNEPYVGIMTEYADCRGHRYFDKYFDIYGWCRGKPFEQCLSQKKHGF